MEEWGPEKAAKKEEDDDGGAEVNGCLEYYYFQLQQRWSFTRFLSSV